jgi:hypothetical protein
MMVPYFYSVTLGYHCQPAWGAVVLALYYTCAAAGLVAAAFATSVAARCVLEYQRPLKSPDAPCCGSVLA